MWSCGVILYALLAGYLLFDDVSIWKLLMKVRQGQYVMPALSPSACDLVQRMLTLDPVERITIEQIKAHDSFRADLPIDYVLPRPMAAHCLLDPVDTTSIADDIADVLRKIGYDDDELGADLTTPGRSMVKVFYYMLTTKIGPERLDWSQAVGTGERTALGGPDIVCDPVDATLVMGNFDPFHRHVTMSPNSSSAGSLSIGSRPEWAASVAGQLPIEQTYRITCRGLTAVDGMTVVQTLMRQIHMAWIHPDDFTVVARNEKIGLYVVMQASISSQEDEIEIGKQLYHGLAEAFQVLCKAFEELLGGIAQIQGFSFS